MSQQMSTTMAERPIQKRARQQLSCNHCKVGKLKCDRGHPCDQCIKRARIDSCLYPAAPIKKSRRPINTKERLSQLEDLLVELMNQGGQPESADTHEVVQQMTPESRSSMEVPNGRPPEQLSTDSDQPNVKQGQSYVGGAHWETVLSGIAELKAALGVEREKASPSPPPDPEPSSPHTSDPIIIIGQPKVTKEYLLKSCPDQGTSERLLWQWFNSFNPMMPTIHKPTFQVEYAKFLNDPNSVSIPWLAMYFALLSQGCETGVFTGQTEADIANSHQQGQYYRQLASDALVLADITRPQRYLVEAMVMYAGSEHMRGPQQSEHRLWLICGVLLRLCLKMGLHRDPSIYPSLSPFECEMRRRIWYLVYIFDVLLSSSLGLPDMIRQVQSDTALPRNLQDIDFSPDTKILPPSRPFTDLQPISYIIVKSGIAKIFARAAEISHAIHHPEPNCVLTLDTELEKVYGTIPEALKFSGMQACIVDGSAVIYNRFKLQLLYQKTRCVLHRRYLTTTDVDSIETSFRSKCVDAAILILIHLETVYTASQAGGQLSSIPLFLDTFSTHDFLLAAMVLCLELTRLRKSLGSQDSQVQQSIATMKRLLEMTYDIYSKPMKHAKIPERAVKALEIMLNKAKESEPTSMNSVAQNLDPSLVPSPVIATTQTLVPPTPMPLPYLSKPFSNPVNSYEPLGDMFNADAINWELWDNIVRQTTEMHASPWDANTGMGINMNLDVTNGFTTNTNTSANTETPSSTNGFPNNWYLAS